VSSNEDGRRTVSELYKRTSTRNHRYGKPSRLVMLALQLTVIVDPAELSTELWDDLCSGGH